MKSMKNIFIIIIIILIILYILFFYDNIFRYIQVIECFNIESVLNKSAGFYSMFFFTLNHYLYCKENRQNFKINSDDWIYKYELGWLDYFEPVELKYNNEEYKKKCHNEVVKDYTIKQYQQIINEVYIYNNTIINEIKKVNNQLNLKKNEYDSIFIRRGDKLLDESKIIYEKEYLNLLLKLNPNCKIIFLQTDDYNCFISLQKLLTDKNIKLYTLCEETNFGTVLTKGLKERLNNGETNLSSNNEYIKNTNYSITKSTEEMSKEEIKEHTIKMIVGIDIVRNSKICVTDYQSNVGRFIKLSHHNQSNVYDVVTSSNIIDYDKSICPAYSF